ncbi:MAG: protease inhibitor I42 family protein [Aquabacterium sp.]|nr:protease inhibitor I42 family protein [Aquabacterium sp.]
MPSRDRPTLHLLATAGKPLAIMLDAQPSAGLLWQAPPPPSGCQLVADSQAPAGAGDGGGVQQQFKFTAPVAGDYSLRFALQRSWDDQPLAVQVVAVTVR